MTDPFAPEDGKKLSRALAADIVLSTTNGTRYRTLDAVGGVVNGGTTTPSFIIQGPGEYEVKDVFVTGVPVLPADNGDAKSEAKEKPLHTIYYIVIDDVHILHLGPLAHPLHNKDIEQFSNIDVLFVPIGGHDVLNAKQAEELVQQLEPRVIVPIMYKSGSVGVAYDSIEPFLKAMGSGKKEALPKLKLLKKDMPQDEMQVMVLEAV